MTILVALRASVSWPIFRNDESWSQWEEIFGNNGIPHLRFRGRTLVLPAAQIF